VADWWDRAQWGLGVRGGAAAGADRRARQHSAGRLSFKPIENIQTYPKKFEFLKSLAGSKDTFPCSKKLK
jgi:hypothetical protein